MATTTSDTSELGVFRRMVEADREAFSPEAAQAILRLAFAKEDLKRIKVLAAKNRAGKITPAEDDEFEAYLRAGQTLAILQSKARQSLKKQSATPDLKRRKS